MRVAFRTDSSLQIGTGHAVRCLTLADALSERGAQCRFICRAHEGHLINLIVQRGYHVDTPPMPVGETLNSGPDVAHSSWLGVDWAIDAQQTKHFLGDAGLDWLIVDHYALDYRWELALRSVSRRIMVIDDIANRRHDCDLLLDQNYGSSSERYLGLVPAECAQLHGPEFALLQPVYAKRRVERRDRSGKIERVLVYFSGGADPMNLTGMALRAFQVSALKKIELDIVVGQHCSHIQELKSEARARGNTRIHTQLPDLSALMLNADLAIGAGGVTTWERCCLGLPSIVISIADNQRPACEALARDNFIQYLGHCCDVSTDVISEQVVELLGKRGRLSELSEKGMEFVDGEGVGRLIDALHHRTAK